MDEAMGTEVGETPGQAEPGDAAGTLEAKPQGPSPEAIASSVEALLLSIDKPLSPYRVAQALGLISGEAEERHADHPLAGMADGPAEGDGTGPAARKPKRKGGKGTDAVARGASPLAVVGMAVESLNRHYEATGRSFRIEQVAGGFRVMTLPAYASVLEAYHGRRERASLSRAAVETMAIIAYKQPVTRAGLEAIRGVACGDILRSLMDRRLVTIVGRAEELGRPMLYGTSKQFLEVFGLTSVKDLPSVEEFKSRTGAGADEDE